MQKLNKFLLVSFVLAIFLINIVSAEMLTSEKGVSYDSEIVYQFLFNEWVPVIVDVKDTSNITISKTDSVEVQETKDKGRYMILNNITESVLLTLSGEEFQLEGKLESGRGFYGNITKEGFNKLLSDSRVKKIYDNTIKGHISLSESAPLINADDAWNTLGYTGNGQTICIIDTGINYSHSDLGGCFGGGCKVKGGYDYYNGDSNPMDDNGHGTHVAGIAASEDSTYKGIAYDADLVALKACDDEGDCSKQNVRDALTWCYNNRNTYDISVVSISLGWPNGWGQCGEDFADAEINDLYNVGILLIAASGNDGNENQISYPACQQNVTSVGATYDDNVGPITGCDFRFFGWCLSECTDDTTYADKFACWGNRGPLLDLLAPGCEITSTSSSGGFETKCGTSMSAPHVAGASALLLDKDSSLTPDQIRYKLQTTGVGVYDSESEMTFKRIDIEAALNSICKLGDWQQVGGCGYGSCDANEKYYTRTADPSGCAVESKCEYDVSCDTGPPSGVYPCDYEDGLDSDCPSGYDAVGDYPNCYMSGNNYECELECFRGEYCDTYGGWDYESIIYLGWDGSNDRGDWKYSPYVYTDTSHCYQFYGETYFSVSDWGTADSYKLHAETSWNSNEACKTSSGSVTTAIHTLEPGTGSGYAEGGWAYDYGGGSCTGGTPINDLEGTMTDYMHYRVADYYPDDTDYLYCDVPYTNNINIDSTIYGNSDADCDVDVQGSESYPDEIKVKWYVNGDYTSSETCDGGGADKCDDTSGYTWGHVFTLDNSEYSKDDEVYCIARGYSEDGGHGAYVSSSTTTVSNRVPTLSSISLDVSTAKQGDNIKATASGEADADSDILAMYCCNGPSCTPTTSAHDFCYAVGDSSPYDLYCTGQGVSGDGTKTIRCRTYDGDGYSTIQSDTYTADNTPPTSVTIISPLNQTYDTNLIQFNVTIGETGNCTYSLDGGITNNSMSSSDNQNFTNTNSSMINGNYVANYYCSDNIGNVNATQSVNFTIGAPTDTHKFYIKNDAGENVAWFGDEGNIVLKGSCYSGGSCDNPGPDSFIIANSTDDHVAFINSTGDLCVEVGDCSDQSATCNPTRDAFIVRNSSDYTMSYIDFDGDLCLTGSLYENSNP